MSTAELNSKKLDLISWINGLSDEAMINLLDSLKSSSTKNDWWDQLSEGQQESIEKGLKDAANGNLIASAEFWQTLKNVG